MGKVKALFVAAVLILVFFAYLYASREHGLTILGVAEAAELNNNGEDKYLYLKFDLSQIPAKARIKSATLFMRSMTSIDGNDETIVVCRVLSQNWTTAWDVIEIWRLPVTDRKEHPGKWPKGTDWDSLPITVPLSNELKGGKKFLTLRLSSATNGDRVPKSMEYGGAYEIGNAVYKQVWYSPSITSDQNNWPRIEIVYTLGF